MELLGILCLIIFVIVLILSWGQSEREEPFQHRNFYYSRDKPVHQYYNSRSWSTNDDTGLQSSSVNSHQTTGARQKERGNWQQRSVYTSQGAFHGLVQRIVNTFRHQRLQGYQFAVLILSPYQDVARKLTLLTRTSEVTTLDQATNCNNPTYPFHHDLCNYVTARPDGPTHAEALLMNRFDPLIRSYNAQEMPECRSILIYTWLFPCDYCKREMIKKLHSYVTDCEVIVVYTSTMADLDEGHVYRSTQEFEQTGIVVRQEDYDHYLSPA